MEKLEKSIDKFLKIVGLEWISDYIKVKTACESVIKAYGDVNFENFRNGCLFLKINDKKLVMDIYYKQIFIIKSINAIIGQNLVKEIKFIK